MIEYEDLNKAFLSALAADWQDNAEAASTTIAVLSSQVSIWRSRANYYRGRCEGMAETVAYLKARVETLEARVRAPEEES